jgi:hypothetical protein
MKKKLSEKKAALRAIKSLLHPMESEIEADVERYSGSRWDHHNRVNKDIIKNQSWVVSEIRKHEKKIHNAFMHIARAHGYSS